MPFLFLWKELMFINEINQIKMVLEKYCTEDDVIITIPIVQREEVSDVGKEIQDRSGGNQDG